MANATKELTKEIRNTADAAVTNAKETVDAVRRGFTDTAGNVKDAAQNVFLAGLGALVAAKETGEETFDTLVKRGEKVDLGAVGTERVKTIRKQIDGATDKVEDAVKGRVSDAKYVAGETANSVEDRIQDAVAVVMKRIGVPTREEISELTASVERLTARVEEVKETRALEASIPAPEAPSAMTVESVGGGWYEIQSEGEVVSKVKGRKALVTALADMQTSGEIAIVPTSNGWYEVRVGTVVVEKAQGEDAAEAAASRLR